MKKKFWLAVILSVLIIMSNVATSYAVQGFTPCPLRGQEKKYWCWAASTQMLLESKWYYKKQSEIVTFIYGSPIDEGARAIDVEREAEWGSYGNLSQTPFYYLTYKWVESIN